MRKTYLLKDISIIHLLIKRPFIIFLRGDLGVGKTTFSKYIINTILKKNKIITSPTYSYYNKYDDIYHFDLYRLNNYDEFFSIGGEEILDNNSGVIIIEWPELIDRYYTPDLDITLSMGMNNDERIIDIIRKV